VDTVDKSTRSRMMSAVRSKNTTLEVELRRRLFRLGYRYRLHEHGLPGKPDMVFPKYRAVVFVNGCFWHNHDCRFGALPATRRQWWRKKLEGNRKRDATTMGALHDQGWRTLVVWECSIRQKTGRRVTALQDVSARISRFLSSKQDKALISGPRIRVKTRRSGE
jgi:DNA mismatch endonuclease (patch repair protein)